MKHCVKAFLVSLERELPADPSIAYEGRPPVIGCNHLVCRKCGAVVRHVDHRSVTGKLPPVADEIRALYESPTPEQSPLLNSAPLHDTSRAYFCRCDWAAVNISGSQRVDDLDHQDWACAGHEPAGKAADAPAVAAMAAAQATLIAQAEAQTAELRKRYVPVEGAKIRFKYAVNVNPAFATASELRDCLLASYPDAAYFGGPVVGKNRDDTAPAWGWAAELIGKRSDWWPALGIALQHAVKDGGDLARIAFATLLADYRATVALLPWTAPVAQAQSFDVRAPGSGTGWGMPDCRIDSIVRDQQAWFAEVRGDTEAFFDGYGRNGSAIKGPFTNEADLRALLAESARAGQFPDGSNGPWSWIGDELITGEAWLRPALVHAILTIDAANEPMVLALLDWCSEERDLWQFVSLLDGWDAQHPAWWDNPADTKPAGWRRTMRSSHWPEVSTLGDVVLEALRRAKLQIATPPIVDLPVLYGPNIS